MIDYHMIDAQSIYTHTVQIDPMRALPGLGCTEPLPQLQGEQVARWTGVAWEVLDERPLPPHPTMIYPRFVGNEKLDLFTMQEQLAVVEATMTDPIVKLMYDRLLGSAYLTYEDPETEQGLALLESKGLITAERKAEIVAQMQPR